LSIEFVPARWWQAIDFLRTDFETMRGHDPWSDQVLSQPWSPSSLIEYAYSLVSLSDSSPYFITSSGERVGTLWLRTRESVQYIVSLGLLPDYRELASGMEAGRLLIKAVRIIERHAKERHSEVTVGRLGARNTAVQRMVKVFGAEPLGLATTTLKVKPESLPAPSSTLELNEINRGERKSAWRRWLLRSVEHVAGEDGVTAATKLREAFSWIAPPPKGRYLSLRRGGETVGLAVIEGQNSIGLFVVPALWSGAGTAAVVSDLARQETNPVRALTLTQAHADKLGTEAFDYDRNPSTERHFVYWIVKDYFEKHK